MSQRAQRGVTNVRPTRLEIDPSALVHNAAILHAFIGKPIWAVVKADGYGHGAVTVARALVGQPAVVGFAVSLVEEGVALREAGIAAPILVLGPAQHGGEAAMIANRLAAAVSDVGALGALGEVARGMQRPAQVHLKIDTGMGRLGIAPAGMADALRAVSAQPLLQLAGVMTHFATADDDDPRDLDSATARQLAAFAGPIAAARQVAPGAMIHAANSSGAINFPSARFDAVRIGLALYGNGHWDVASDAAHRLAQRRQAMRFVTQVVQLRDLPVGHAVGYGQIWRAARPSRVAVLPVGYADGYPRRMSGHASVLLAGRRVPVVGTVSMDMIVADVTDLQGVGLGDECVLLGGDGHGNSISAAEFASWSGLTEYEVTCGISKRVPRVEPA